MCLYLYRYEMPFHPLLGLQLFTLADLMHNYGIENTEKESREIYKWCQHSLALSFAYVNMFCDNNGYG